MIFPLLENNFPGNWIFILFYFGSVKTQGNLLMKNVVLGVFNFPKKESFPQKIM
jgi:hypothetical protein